MSNSTKLTEALKFVQGAVAKKDFVPVLTHFCIENGTVRSYNGELALSSPIDLALECKPNAVQMAKAIAQCEDVITIAIMESGNLKLTSGPFKAFIKSTTDETPHVLPEGEPFDLNGEAFIKGLKIVKDFIGDDASKPWANGVRLANHSMYATNNPVLIQLWLGDVFPVDVIIPKSAVKELTRIKAYPISGQVTDKSITFHYEDGRWLRSTLIDADWPDVDRMLGDGSEAVPVETDVFKAVEALLKLTDKNGRIYIMDGRVSTGFGEEGASYEIDDPFLNGVFNCDNLMLMAKVATHVNWNTNPVQFYGNNIRGLMLGYKSEK